MTEPATFVTDQKTGRIEVMLGLHVVARITPLSDGARYHIKLPGPDGARLVDSIGKARRLVLHMLADWFLKAGPFFGPVAKSLAAQAELEREAA